MRRFVPALVGLVAVLPFAVMEVVLRARYREPFPVALFVWLGLLCTACAALAPVIARDVRLGMPGSGPWVRITALALLAGLWGVTMLDQLPCFLGVPNCD